MSENTQDIPAPSRIWTVGHSTRPWQDFVGLLQLHRIEAIADVRRHPGSRRYPWFGSEAMAGGLGDAGVAYLWLPELGGRRKVQPGSPNGGWRNASFQGYADHMASGEFADALARALELARTKRTALMCAELLWWQCHRRLIADLLARRMEVLHIMDAKPPQPHVPHPLARMEAGHLVYPPAQGGLFADDASS